MATTVTSLGTIETGIMSMYNTYRNLKPKYRATVDDNIYYMLGLNVMLSMFVHDDRIFRPELLELFLHDTGSAALIKTDTSDYTPVLINFVGGDRYADGYFKNCVCFDLTGREYQFTDWRDNPDIFVFFNNLTHTPDYFLDKYAYYLSECDKSINNNVIFARAKPIPIAPDAASKNKIDTAMTDLQDGRINTIVMDRGIREILDDGKPPFDILNISEVDKSSYIQYLAHLHDTLMSRLYYMLGISRIDTGKQAQISTAELTKNDAGAIANIQSWKIAREKAYQEITKKNGETWSLKLNDVWQYVTDTTLDGEDVTGDADAEPEPESEPESEQSDTGSVE